MTTTLEEVVQVTDPDSFFALEFFAHFAVHGVGTCHSLGGRMSIVNFLLQDFAYSHIYLLGIVVLTGSVNRRLEKFWTAVLELQC